MSDYRETRYCESLDGILDRKSTFMVAFRKEHPRVKDIHRYVYPNDSRYKSEFIEIYKGKCAYCGASIKFIPKEMFEIDHFLPKEMVRFVTKADAGKIENLVLACHTCNHNKSSFEVPDELYSNLHPDHDGIKNAFFRDDMFYIRLSTGQPVAVARFYEQLRLGRETVRLDYLLTCMYGLCERTKDKEELNAMLEKAIRLLQAKRNLGVTSALLSGETERD